MIIDATVKWVYLVKSSKMPALRYREETKSKRVYFRVLVHWYVEPMAFYCCVCLLFYFIPNFFLLHSIPKYYKNC